MSDIDKIYVKMRQESRKLISQYQQEVDRAYDKSAPNIRNMQSKSEKEFAKKLKDLGISSL